MLYFKCGKHRHISKWCKGTEKCLNCAGDHFSSKDSPCNELPKCLNCSNPHCTRVRNCLVFKKYSAIIRSMALDNISFAEAKWNISKVQDNFFNSLRTELIRTQQNFPELLNRSSPSNHIPQPLLLLVSYWDATSRTPSGKIKATHTSDTLSITNKIQKTTDTRLNPPLRILLTKLWIAH